MAEETGKEKDKDYGKKCAHTGAAIKRVKRYYRNGKYYKNKRAFMDAVKKAAEDAAKEPAKA